MNGPDFTAPPRFDLGGCTITVLNGGRFKLDGGAMFGLIPKPLWARLAPTDEQNRIPMACNCLLVEWTGAAARRAVIETGRGAKFGEKERKIYDIDPAVWLLPSLQDVGVGADTITDVVLSHLHFDHAGGLTYEREGRLFPTFPNAKVHVQKREFDDARVNFGIMTTTYREHNYTPIDQIDGWRLLDGEAAILPGVRAVLTPGHTRGHHSLVIEGRDRTAIFTGDVMPTRHHVGRAYNMGYDLFPLDNAGSKQRVLQAAAENEWLVFIDHDPDVPAVRVARDKDFYALTAAV